MAAQTKAVMQEFLQYLAQRRSDALTALFAEQVDWHIPGDEEKSPWLGRRSTREEVRAYYDLLWANTEPVDAAVDGLFIEGDEAAVTGTFTTRMLPTGKTVHSLFCIRITVQDGRIVRYRLLEDTLAVAEAMT